MSQYQSYTLPRNARSEAAKAKNLSPCSVCQKHRKGCRGGIPCERCCNERKKPGDCKLGRMDAAERFSIIMESGQSPTSNTGKSTTASSAVSTPPSGNAATLGSRARDSGSEVTGTTVVDAHLPSATPINSNGANGQASSPGVGVRGGGTTQSRQHQAELQRGLTNILACTNAHFEWYEGQARGAGCSQVGVHRGNMSHYGEPSRSRIVQEVNGAVEITADGEGFSQLPNVPDHSGGQGREQPATKYNGSAHQWVNFDFGFSHHEPEMPLVPVYMDGAFTSELVEYSAWSDEVGGGIPTSFNYK